MRSLFPVLLIAILTGSGAALAADKGQPSINSNLEPPMVRISSGSFDMGSKHLISNERPVHRVNISYAFEISKTEVTQGQWKAVMGENPSHFGKCGDDCPVENVSWQDATNFVKQLNMKTAKEYRLPTEAEWEYACRAGGNEAYCGGGSVGKVAWYMLNGGAKTSHVAQRKPNAWGLYDMSGNVWEWTQDCWNGTYNGAPTDGSAWTTGDCNKRALRGGSWSNTPDYLRADNRAEKGIDERDIDVGFRVARSLE